MRSARILGDAGHSNVYHVTNRCINKEHLLEDAADKEHFVYLMLRHARVMGIEVITFCVMDNHFHGLFRVPDQEVGLAEISDDEAVRRFQPVYPGERWNMILDEWKRVQESRSDSWRKAFVGKFRDRLFRLDRFVSELKGMFAIYYNEKYERSGTIWGDRFHSVLVEEHPEIMRLMAAYIDLNPVRAGLVTDPKDYRWCGYAKALAGSGVCQRGLLSLYKAEFDLNWPTFAQIYRLRLFGEGQEQVAPDGKIVKSGINASLVEDVRNQEGQLPYVTLLDHRIRYLSDGLAIGSTEYVERLYTQAKMKMGTKRKVGARQPKSSVVGKFRTLKSVR